MRASHGEAPSLGSAVNDTNEATPVKESDLKRVEAHMKRTFNHGGIKVKARKVADSAEVYVDDEFIGVVFEDEDEAGSFMFEMAILAEDLPQD
jgi:hypothetical protein